MAFSQSQVTASYANEDGTVPTGSVEFTLAESLTNGTVTLTGGFSCSAQIDASGNVAQTLVSTEDPDTFPSGGQYRVIERLDGAPVVTYFTPLPAGPVDLSALRPGAAGPPDAG